jgi:hypothetical protein
LNVCETYLNNIFFKQIMYTKYICILDSKYFYIRYICTLDSKNPNNVMYLQLVFLILMKIYHCISLVM